MDDRNRLRERESEREREKESERESGKSVLAALLDTDENDLKL